MPQTLFEKFQKIINEDENSYSEQNQRQLISEILLFLEQKEEFPPEFSADYKKQDIVKICLQKLRQLNNKSHIRQTQCKMYTVELDKLIDEICLCSNILLSDEGVSINFKFEPQTVACSPTLIIDAFLNLISNAIKFGMKKNIDVSIKSTPCQAIINVSDNSPEITEFDFKSGLESVQNICRLHRGRLLFSHQRDVLTASIAISKSLRGEENFVLPAFSQYLSDNYSQLYVGLAEFGLSDN